MRSDSVISKVPSRTFSWIFSLFQCRLEFGLKKLKKSNYVENFIKKVKHTQKSIKCDIKGFL